MAKDKKLKRKATPLLKNKPSNDVEQKDESEPESEEEEFNLNDVNDESEHSGGDSDNGNEAIYSSDDDDELSFESDDEGNYKQNENKLKKLVNSRAGVSKGSDDSEEGEEQESGEEVDGYASDTEDEEDIDDEESVDENDDSEVVYSSDDELGFEEQGMGKLKRAPLKPHKQNKNTLKNSANVRKKTKNDQESEEDEEEVDGYASDEEDEDETADNESSEISLNEKEENNKKAKTTAESDRNILKVKNKAKSNLTNGNPKSNNKIGTTSKGKKDKLNAVEALKNKLNTESGTQPKNAEADEYEHDTSDEEDIRNTVGNIPMHWYDEYKHIGYDWDAKQLIKPGKRDQLDDFLKRMEDPDFWRTVKDPQTGQDVILSEADIDLIKRINLRRNPDATFDEYAPWVEWFTSEVEKMPIRNVPDHKRSFLPSRSEKKAVSKLVHAIKMGWMKTSAESEKEKAKKGPNFYMLWETDTGKEDMRRIHDHVSAPKRDLPGHAESYNPPPEYLFDEKETKEWHKFKDEPSKRKLHFLPQKYNSLREVPSYPRYVRERFLRCLDLYLCPRAKRMKLTIDAEYLIPKLPSPRDLQPFPTVENMIYTGHTDIIRTVTVEPRGEYIASGSDDKTVKIWEIQTGRCIKTIDTGDIVRSVAWSPNPKISLIAITSGQRLILLNPLVGDKVLTKKTDEILTEAPQIDTLENERIKTAVQWSVAEGDDYEAGYRLIITHFKTITQATWHGRGDYIATVMPDGANRSTLIHQLSKRRSQFPFTKSKGLIQCVLFHPVKPCLFVATQKNIRIYDLVKQEMLKKLISNSKWISHMAIHPKGDNLLVSTYDKKMLWFDLDLSTKPYQTIRLHKNAVRSVAFHLRYPLFASASDDQSVIVSHGMVYNDLLQNPLIVPLKKLLGHSQHDDFGVFGVVWHPTQPWLFSSGADATIRLYT